MIKITGLSKRFGDKTVFRDLDMKIPHNEITCIMGESGLGKTTLLRLIMGLESCDEGKIEGAQEKVGVMFQEDRLIEDLSPVSNVRIANRKLHTEEAVKRLMEVGIHEKLTSRVSDLSGGMARRVALVRALSTDADLLIFDEPFKGLDSMNIERCVASIEKYRNRRTLIAVVHSLEEAKLLNAGVIDLGEVIRCRKQ